VFKCCTEWPADIISRWRHNWKSAQVVNSHLECDRETGNRVLTSLGDSGFYWTIFARNRDNAVPAEGNGDLQTLICVLVARPRRCPTLSNPVLWQNWMAAYPGCTLQMKTLFPGWPIMVRDTHMRRRRRLSDRLHHLHVMTKHVKMVWACSKKGWGWLGKMYGLWDRRCSRDRSKKTWKELADNDLRYLHLCIWCTTP